MSRPKTADEASWRCPWRILLLLPLILAVGVGCAGDDDDDDPGIVSLSPRVGPLAGGTAVDIRVEDFERSFLKQAPTVEFGGVPAASVVVVGARRITATTPPSAVEASVSLAVRSGDGKDVARLPQAFLFTDRPVPQQVIPSSGDIAGGQPATILGANFDPVGITVVSFGSLDATGVTVVDATTIQCTTPPNPAGPVTITVTNPGGLQGQLVDGYTYSGVDPAVVAMEDQVFQLINQERANVGKPALVHDPVLRIVARAHSEDMRDRIFFDHVNPDGRTPGERVTLAGVSWTAVAENIAWNEGYSDPGAQAVAQWMGSSGHRRNLLDENNVGYTLTGVGVSTNGSRWWFTQVFVRQ